MSAHLYHDLRCHVRHRALEHRGDVCLHVVHLERQPKVSHLVMPSMVWPQDVGEG
jgi:hypothetical protein